MPVPNFVVVSLTPCPTCNMPILHSSWLEKRPSDEELDSRLLDPHCTGCGWESRQSADSLAAKTIVVDWSARKNLPGRTDIAA